MCDVYSYSCVEIETKGVNTNNTIYTYTNADV